MRIVAGSFRGRTLQTPPGGATRPTADRTRQALFNVLEHAAWAPDLDGARVLDLFAGSGALGLEALSRGAATATFVESAEPACAALRANIAALRVEDRARLHRRDATIAGAPPPQPFDLVFLDPPYAKGLGERALAALASPDWLAPEALVVFERGVDEPAPILPGYDQVDARDWGAARVLFLSPAAR